ncbi:MAG: malto-oligosyltrehalose trehalohydrolase [Gemmatimonadales bacterium]
MVARHEMPFGAVPLPDGGVRFRLWAPDAQEVTLRLEGPGPAEEMPLRAVGEGWHELRSVHAEAGSRYRYRIDGDLLVPDPASRFQPDGVDGPSEVIDPGAWDWPEDEWRGRPWEEMVIQEIHVGTFAPGGRYADVVEALDGLAALGVTAIELMPIAECPGAHNWGYDGVLPYAPECAYGRPEDLKRLVAEAHARRLCVLLDVVYNHFGPEGNYLGHYASPFFTERHRTPWGSAIDFETARPVRDYFVHNALYWLEEYRMDGLRIDAVHAIRDASRPDVLEELAARVRARFDGEREVHLVLENDRNEARRLVRDGDGRPRSYTAQWNDDVHHALHVLLTGERDGYYRDYADDPVRHLGRALAEGFAFQGERSVHRGRPRGEPSGGLPPTAFVNYLQNHDQIGNRARGDRLSQLAAPEALRAAASVLLLAPAVPLLFMGEEWGAPEPFPFFADFGHELAEAVRAGRLREHAAFVGFADAAAAARIPDPCAPETFRNAVLDRRRAAVSPHAEQLALHRALLARRHAEIVPRLRSAAGGASFEPLGERALRVAWRLDGDARLVLVAQLGPEVWRGAPLAERGRLLWEVPEGAAHASREGRLPAWSALWWLDDD